MIAVITEHKSRDLFKNLNIVLLQSKCILLLLLFLKYKEDELKFNFVVYDMNTR
jgi:hypothetical protein